VLTRKDVLCSNKAGTLTLNKLGVIIKFNWSYLLRIFPWGLLPLNLLFPNPSSASENFCADMWACNTDLRLCLCCVTIRWQERKRSEESGHHWQWRLDLLCHGGRFNLGSMMNYCQILWLSSTQLILLHDCLEHSHVACVMLDHLQKLCRAFIAIAGKFLSLDYCYVFDQVLLCKLSTTFGMISDMYMYLYCIVSLILRYDCIDG
jgi:hypothetical protein